MVVIGEKEGFGSTEMDLVRESEAAKDGRRGALGLRYPRKSMSSRTGKESDESTYSVMQREMRLGAFYDSVSKISPGHVARPTLITPSSLPAVTKRPLTASSCVLRLPIVRKSLKLRCRMYGPGGGSSSE